MSEQSKTRQVGIVSVDMEVLARAFHFPEGHRIVDVRRKDMGWDQFEILCEGPTLPEVGVGAPTPNVQYLISVTESGEMVRKREYTGSFQSHADVAVGSIFKRPPSEESAA